MNRLALPLLALVVLAPDVVYAQVPIARPTGRAQTTRRTQTTGRARTTRRTQTPRRARPATPPPVTARITLAPRDGNRFHFDVTVTLEGEPGWALLADHRALSFEITPAQVEADGEPRRRRRARPLTCKHPNAPRRVEDARVVRDPARFSEPIDLRMYCIGRAYDALVAGASVVPVYGFRRASRTTYLARPTSEDATARPLASVRGEAFVPYPASARPEQAGEDAPLMVGLVPTEATAPGAPVLRAFVRARRPVRLYMRDDLYTFRITSPSGTTTTCAPRRTVVVPIIDFFKRLSAGARVETSTDTARHCAAIFREPGIYEVTPELELPYGGERYQIEAVTGRFTGAPSFVRVRPQRGAYVVLGT